MSGSLSSKQEQDLKAESKLDGLVWAEPGPSGDQAVPLAQLLQGLQLMASDDDREAAARSSGWAAETPPSMQVIKSGALSITKTWTKRVTGAGIGASVVLGAVGSGVAALTDGLTPAVGAALVGGIALVASATALALAIFVKADLDARGQATAARHAGRAEVAAAFLSATAPRPAAVDVDKVAAAAVEKIRSDDAAAQTADAETQALQATQAAAAGILFNLLHLIPLQQARSANNQPQPSTSAR
jgi:hypothetical protein